MAMPGIPPGHLRVTCDSCGTTAHTQNGADPDAAVDCGCCPEDHSHAGPGCARTVTITATAYLSGSAG
jgi:hypothetical protein